MIVIRDPALSLKFSDVDLERKVLVVRASNSKSKKQRAVPINSVAAEIIRNRLNTKGNDEYLFINRRTGKPYTTIMKVWNRLRNKAGLPHLRIHDLRHSYASFLVNSGRTLYEVQKILGHASASTSERYSHLSSKSLQDAANTASVIITGAMPVAEVETDGVVPGAVQQAA